MLRNTLGQITFNQMVYAIIAIIVLVIVIMVFSGNLGNQDERLNSCITQGGSCVPVGECGGDKKVISEDEFRDCNKKTDDTNVEHVCCVGLFI